MKKPFAKFALSLIVVAILIAIASFIRENWSANDRPGSVETFFAKLFLSRSRNSEAERKNPLQSTQENLAEGKRLYEKECAFCHGIEGKGQGESGLQFYPPVPSLVGKAETLSDGQVQFIVREGIRYTAMPSFTRELSQDDIWKVVLWTRKLMQPSGTAKH